MNFNIFGINLSKNWFLYLVLILIFFQEWDVAIAQDVDSTNTKNKKSKKHNFKDPEDGAFDISSFILDNKGFMPVPLIITEPAVGYGGGLVLLFFHKQKKKYDIKVPPNITGVVGLGTQNKTWIAGVFHFHVWGPDKVRYFGAVSKPMINVKYYGNNNDYLSKKPLKLNLNAWVLVQRVQVRIAKSNLFAGGSYIYFTTENSVDTLPGRPIINEIIKKLERRSTISLLQSMINWDSRDNIFTPRTGLNTGFIFSYNATWLGADEDFYKLNPYFLGYQSISNKIFSGWRFDADFMLGDAPLYALPFIELRGVPALRYQSDNTMLIETQWDFIIRKRWSLDVFAGTGKAFPSFSQFGPSQWVYNYGVGFRYKMASALGMWAGIDFAFSNNNEFAFYIIIGTAWGK